MSQNIIKTDEYRSLIADLKTRVKATQIKAAVAVNTQLIALYWEIGQQIAERQQASGWGDTVIEQIAKDLSREFQNMKGFSRANLYRMTRFYAFYASQEEFVAQLVRQIPWGHNILIFQQIKDHNKALWYVRKTNEDYNAALEEIEQLMDARADTPEGDRLDVLTTVVNAWEEVHFPIEEPKTGGAVLWQALKEGEDSGRADYSLKGLLDELDSETDRANNIMITL